MSEQRSYVPILIDTDDHIPERIVWGKPGEKGSELMPIMMHKGTSYTIRYPDGGAAYTYGSVVKASGILEFITDGPVLSGATVEYADGSIKTDGTFYITLFDGVSVE